MAMEGYLPTPSLGTRPEARRHANMTSTLAIIGILSGVGLAVGLLIAIVPFSDQTAMSLSLLS